MNTMMVCIANNGGDNQEEVPFYCCPCLECTKMEWECQMDVGNRSTLKQHRERHWPSTYVKGVS